MNDLVGRCTSSRDFSNQSSSITQRYYDGSETLARPYELLDMYRCRGIEKDPWHFEVFVAAKNLYLRSVVRVRRIQPEIGYSLAGWGRE
jgi:hypothetical protein